MLERQNRRSEAQSQHLGRRRIYAPCCGTSRPMLTLSVYSAAEEPQRYRLVNHRITICGAGSGPLQLASWIVCACSRLLRSLTEIIRSPATIAGRLPTQASNDDGKQGTSLPDLLHCRLVLPMKTRKLKTKRFPSLMVCFVPISVHYALFQRMLG